MQLLNDHMNNSSTEPSFFLLDCGRSAPVYVTECVDSTNDRLKKLADEGVKAGTVLIARRQTAGRGRMSRFFESPESGLYMSILEKPETEPERISTVTPVAAIALVKTIEKLTDLRAGEGEKGISIKWPNDVQIGHRKICGILTELHTSCDSFQKESPWQLIIGIGVNVNTKLPDFSEKVREIAGSVSEAAGTELSLDLFAATMIGEFDALYQAWEENDPGVLSDYRDFCSTVGKEIYVIDTVSGIGKTDEAVRKKAFALGINDDFSLHVRYEDGTCGNINSGEVSVRVR